MAPTVLVYLRLYGVTCLFIAFVFTSASSQNLSIDSLEQLVKTSPDDTNKVIHYRMLTGLLRLKIPPKGIEYGMAGIALGKKLGYDRGVAGCYLNISACYNSLGKLDSSMLLIDTAIVYARMVGEPNRLALAYLNRADLHMQLQNFEKSLLDCDTSMIYANKANNDDRRARVLQTIGSVYFFQKLYNQSEEYYQKANDLYRKIGNLQMSAIVLNNLANVYKHQEKYPLAANNLKEAITIADSLKDLSNLGMYHGTLSDVYLHMENYHLAEVHALKSMEYSQNLKNDIQIGNAWQNLGQLFLKVNKMQEGLDAMAKSHDLFKKIGDLDKIKSTADILAEAYAASGQFSKAYVYLQTSATATDSLARQRYDEDIAALQTRFRLDEKEKEIRILSKDKELQQQRLSRQRTLTFGSLILIILALTGIGLYVSRYRLKNQMKELELRHRIAADLHDEVGSSLSSIHMLSQIAAQQTTPSSKEKDILTRMSTNARETMEKMSDIVWMIKPGESEGGNLRQRMEQFAYEVASNRNIEMIVDLEVLEKEKFTMEQRRNIYLIFKEALNNTLKYSGTEKIEITAGVKDHVFFLRIKDYGIGFEKNLTFKGNGLGNMQKRAKELNGKLDIYSELNTGTRIELQAPL